MKSQTEITNELLFRYFDNLTDAIIIHNSDKRILYYNQSFCGLTKIPPNQVIDANIAYFSISKDNLVHFSYKGNKLTVNGNLEEALLYETEYQQITEGEKEIHINRISLNIALKTKDKTHKSIVNFAEEIPDSVVVINFEGKILYSNKKYPEVDDYLCHNIEQILDSNIETHSDQKEFEVSINNNTFVVSIAINQDLSVCNFYAKNITPRKLAEKKVLKSEERFKKIALFSGAYVWETDLNLNITYISELASDLLKTKTENLINKPFSSLAHKEDKNLINELLKKSIQRESSFTDLQYRTELPDSHTIWFYSSGSPLYNEKKEIIGLSGVSLDFTKTRNQTLFLSETYNQISRILAKMKSGIMVVNAKNKIQHMNPSFSKMFNVENPEDILNSNLHIVLQTIAFETKNPSIFIYKTIKELEENKESFGEVFEMKDGSYLERDFQPIYNHNQHEGYMWSYRNITERIKYEKQLQLAKQQAETANKLKSKFISNVSHEIRTPMNGIFGLIQVLQKENLSDEQQKTLTTLRFSARNLLEIINDLLDIHKIEAGKMNFDNIPFSLEEIIVNLKTTFAPLIEEKNLYLNFHTEDNLPRVLEGDVTRLGQILNNLVSNAFKFTSEGGINVSISKEYIENNTVKLLFKVQDSGIGIAQEKLDTIFESFTQGELDTTRIYGGTGLGLSICKALVEMMGGEISVESERGKGACFTFKLDFAISKQNLPSTNDNHILQEEIDIIAKKSILLVEDNRVNQMVVKKVIKNWGSRLVIANNGQEAIDIISTDKTFDIVLMDLKMPVKDGYEATAEIRSMQDEYYKSLPIVALTASAMQSEKDKLQKAGMNEHLAKPFEIEDLFRTIFKLTSEV